MIHAKFKSHLKYLHLFIILLINNNQWPSANAQISKVSKCCPEDMSLEIKVNDFGSTYYDCATSDNNTIDGYNLVVGTMDDLIPKCIDMEMIEWPGDGIAFISHNGCLDRLVSNGNYVILTCTKTEKIDVHKLNKCCPADYSYDHSERFCIQNPSYLQHFQNFFRDSMVIFETRVPQCASDEVFVEYFSTAHEIQLNRNGLSILPKSQGNQLLAPKKFCVEGLLSNNNATSNGEELHLIVRSCRPKSLCNSIPCIRRCCENDQMIQRIKGKTTCVQHPESKNIMPVFHEIVMPMAVNQPKVIQIEDYGILHKQKCDKYLLDKDNTANRYFLSHLSGELFVADTNKAYDVDSYCIEFTSRQSIELQAFVCFGETVPAKFSYYPIGLMISSVFLAMTLVVYLSLPKLLNLHGKTLVCYVISLLAAYVTLSIIQFHTSTKMTFCYEVAFFLLFCFMGAFGWQTAMCFDIWLTFGSLRSSFGMRHNKNQRKFWYYSLYAWGMPFLWTLFTIIVEKNKLLPNNWNPTVGGTTCFFSNTTNWREHFLYFLLPAGVHVIINSVLFVITAIHCSRVKREIHRMQFESESDLITRRKKFIASKAIFIMNLKLFTVMGTSWILEILSTFTKNEVYESIEDVFNIFLGVFIFLIFVFKKKVIHEFKCKIGIQPRGTTTPRTTTTTNTAVNISLKDRSSVNNPGTSYSKSDLTPLSSSINLNSTNNNQKPE